MGWLKDFIKNPIKRLAKDVSNVFNFVGDLVSGAIGFVGDLFGMNFMPEMPQANVAERNNGTTVNRQGGDSLIPLVYTVSDYNYPNRIKMGGIRVHTSSDGENNKYLYVTYILGHGPMTYIQVLDPELSKTTDIIPGFASRTEWTGLDHNSSDGVTKEGNIYTYGSSVYGKVFIHTGNTSDMTTTPSWHKDTLTYPGLAHVKIRLEMPSPSANLDPVPFTGLPNFDFFVKRKVSSIGGSTAFGYADMLYDYLTSKVYGPGLATADIDLTSFQAYQPSTMTSPAEGRNAITNLFWRIPPGQTHSENIKQMLFEMGATLIWRNGKWVLKENPNMMITKRQNDKFSGVTKYTIAEEDIVGGVQLENTPVDQRYSSVKANWYDTVNNSSTGPGGGGLFGTGWLFQYADWAKLSKVIPENNILEIGTMGPTWSLLTTTWLESNNSATVSFTVNSKYLSVEPYDVVKVTYTNANLSNVQFIVTNVSINPNLTVTIQGKQVYSDTALDNANEYLLPYIKDNAETSVKRKDLVKVPTGIGLTNNTQVDQFFNSPNKLPSISSITVDTDTGLSILKDDGSYNVRVRVNIVEDVEPDINTYRYELKEQGQPEYNVVANTTGIEILLLTLKPNMPYDLKVTPVTQSGREGNVTTTTFTTGNIQNTGQQKYFADNIQTSEQYPQGISNSTVFDDAYYVWGHADYNYDTSTGTGGDHPGLDDNFVKGVYTEAQWDQYVGSWGAHDYSGASPPTGNFYPPVNRWWGNPSWIGFAAALNVQTRESVEMDTGVVDEYWWTARVKAFPSNDSVQWFNDSSATYEIDNKMITNIDGKDTSGGSYSSVYSQSGSSSQQLAEPVSGRYFKTTYAGIAANIGTYVVPTQLEMTFRSDVWTHTFSNVDTSVLSGSSSARTYSWTTPRYMKIKEVIIKSAYTETDNVTGFLTTTPTVNTNSITFKVVNVSDGAATDAVVDITVIGYPEVKQEDLGSDYGFGDYVINWENKQ